MADQAKRSKPTISEKTPEATARQVMFDFSPVCCQCSDDIDRIEDARALLCLGSDTWKLLHREQCYGEALFFPGLNGRSPRGISPSSYRGRFG